MPVLVAAASTTQFGSFALVGTGIDVTPHAAPLHLQVPMEISQDSIFGAQLPVHVRQLPAGVTEAIKKDGA